MWTPRRRHGFEMSRLHRAPAPAPRRCRGAAVSSSTAPTVWEGRSIMATSDEARSGQFCPGGATTRVPAGSARMRSGSGTVIRGAADARYCGGVRPGPGTGTTGASTPTAPLNSRSRGRLTRAARANGADDGRTPGGVRRAALLGTWLLLSLAVAGALFAAAPATRPPGWGDSAAAIQRLGPWRTRNLLPMCRAMGRAACGPRPRRRRGSRDRRRAEQRSSSPPGRCPQPLRAAPDRAAETLVQVPDHAALEDIGEITPDGAWRHVAWDGWDGWIAAGLLLRRP